MRTMIDTILSADFSLATVFGWTILHSIWQIALIALVLKLLLEWTSKHASTVRYSLSLLAMFVALTWSVHTFFSELERYDLVNSTLHDSASTNLSLTLLSTGEFEQTIFGSFEENTRLLTQYIEPIMPYLAVFWLIGMLFFSSRILVGLVRLRTFSRQGTQLLPTRWQYQFEELKRLSRIGRTVEVRLSDLMPVPVTYQFFRPIILLPVSVFTGLSDEQIEVLLLHELAHIKRHDYVVNLVQSIIEVLFFYHPFIWWISKNVRAEREHCCDDEVMKLRHQPMLYAQTLTQIQSQHYSFKTKLAMSANGNKGEFSQRIYRLFQKQEPHFKVRNSVTALLLLIFSALTMAFYPNPKQTTQSSEVVLEEIKQDTVPIETVKTKEKKLAKKPVATTIYNVESTEIDENTKVIEVISIPREGVEIGTTENEASSPNRKKDKEISTENVKTTYTVETDKGDKVNVRISENEELLTLKSLKGKSPIIYLDGKQYSDSEIDSEGKLMLDIPTEKVSSVNVYKGEKSKDKFGVDSKDGVIEIFTHDGENVKTTTIPKEHKIVLGRKKRTSSEQPLFVIDGEIVKSENVDKNLSPDDIISINVLKDESAFEKYGAEGENGVVEIFTKGKRLKKKKIKEEKRPKSDRVVKGRITGDRKTQESRVRERKLKKSSKTDNPVAETIEARLSVFPNPTDNVTNIQVRVEEKGHVKVDIYNRFGQLMETVVNQTLEKGKYQYNWNAKDQVSGTYFIHLDLDGETIAKQFFVKK